MPVYPIELRPQASKALRQLPAEIRNRIARRIDQLADDPRQPGCVKLKGRDGYRARAGDYRIVYLILDDTLVVMEIAHRRDVYRLR